MESTHDTLPRSSRGISRYLAGAGLALAGVSLGAFWHAVSPQVAEAGDANFVKSSSHETVSGVRLDEELTIRFATGVLPQSVGPDTILIRTSANEQARGEFVVGKFMYDRRTQRRVVVRPEAVREYYQLQKGLSRQDAERRARRLLSAVERGGRTKLLKKVDAGLVKFFGPSYGAGTRLDDESVFATYPPPLLPGDALEPYRRRVAGDDALWQAAFNGDAAAFVELSQNSEFERFFHERDPATGVPAPDSVLRQREYRQVLLNRRPSRRVMFVPEIPIKGDLSDTGMSPGIAYKITIPSSQPGVFNTILSQDRRPLLQRNGRDYSTYFTTIPGTVASGNLFLDNESRIGVASLQVPRVINVTPPNGETFVDPTTDWEDPDNSAAVPLPARRTFAIRLRFAQPLDPRTVNPTNFTVTKVATNPGPNQTSVNIPVAVGTFLNQRRLGLVEVEVTPATNLDPSSQYEVVVKGLVKSLGGALLNKDFRATFITGAGDPPLDAIRENFTSAANRADPGNPDTLGQITTAHWPAPAYLDPSLTGRAVASFMPFVGTGIGAPEDPQDSSSGNLVQDLALEPGQTLTFLTENLDPASPTFGRQIEYNYRSVSMSFATARAVGRYPLVIRSQHGVSLDSSLILVNGVAGGDGLTNSDTVNGGPTGGLGGDGGPGGHRGGDGAYAPLTDDQNLPVTGVDGKFQFDQEKSFGRDGSPGYAIVGPNTGGAGAGGFSGDHEHVLYDANGDGMTDETTDGPVIPERIRESGGGGGHATPGGDGAGARGSLELHTDGHEGGLGGVTYGVADFGDQPLNNLGVPTLGRSAGGAGGGGGGGEDDPDAFSGSLGTVGPEDAGGGGGGGGGGGVQIVSRTQIRISSSRIDASGGAGGRTFNANRSDVGQGAPGGCGAGGGIWLQCLEGDVIIENGSTVTAAGGDNTNSVGQITSDPTGTSFLRGKGGLGGDGFVRIEDQDGQSNIVGSEVRGTLSVAEFTPDENGGYPSHPSAPMVINQSVAYSRWFNSQLDTPTFLLAFDDPATPNVDGTLFDESTAFGGSIEIFARTAPNDPANNGHPNLFLATPWTNVDDPDFVEKVGDRRFLQFRIDFAVPFSFDFANPLPFVDFLQFDIELQ